MLTIVGSSNKSYLILLRFLIVTDIELNRLVRSEHFNLSSRRFNHIHETTARERQILRGISDLRRHKLMQRSGAINELFMNYPDHRMLAIGVLEIEP